MKRLLHTPLALLLRRIVLLYAVLMLCRVVFYLYNAQLLGTIGRGELWQLLAGSLKFDTVSVIYANGVFILLALLPLHVRERGWYRKLMYCPGGGRLCGAQCPELPIQIPGDAAAQDRCEL